MIFEKTLKKYEQVRIKKILFQLESCICVTTLISEGVWEELLGVGVVFECGDVPERGVFESIKVDLVVIC